MRHASYIENSASRQREKGADLRVLRQLARYLRPYLLPIAGAFLALIVAAATVLSIGQGLRFLIDRGLTSDDGALLNDALLVLSLIHI